MIENSFTDWVRENLADDLEDVYQYGCSAGFSGITYYAETRALYDTYKDDIWEIMADEAAEGGEKSVMAWAANESDIESASDFENWMVWAAIEAIALAAQMAEEETEEDDN